MMHVTSFKEFIPLPIRRLYGTTLDKIIYPLVDYVDKLFAGPDSLFPPRNLSYITTSVKDNIEYGINTVKDIISVADIKSTETILEVGCGAGFKAFPFGEYLKYGGSYTGIDILRNTIAWLQENATRRYPSLHFDFSDVLNQWYNSIGKIPASKYKLPYKDGIFDFVFLTSVFTHMLPVDIENYISEIVRVLKPGGRCLITFFLLNDESERFIKSGSSLYNFSYEMEGYRTTDKNHPEKAIAYKEDYVFNLFRKYGLTIRFPVSYGPWCGRRGSWCHQDAVIATKR